MNLNNRLYLINNLKDKYFLNLENEKKIKVIARKKKLKFNYGIKLSEFRISICEFENNLIVNSQYDIGFDPKVKKQLSIYLNYLCLHGQFDFTNFHRFKDLLILRHKYEYNNLGEL